jgi:hypothetical protein
MDARREGERRHEQHTTVERKSERELVVTRTFNAPARIVFEAWTKPECSAVVGAEVDGRALLSARWMFVSAASTVSSSATMPHGLRFFGSTSK